MNEQNIPIDIHLNKLLDWLISRRICPRDWQKNTLVVRQNINNAIQDMPAVEEIANLLAGTYINYFHCQRIVELLKETESSTKNIFGQYSSQRMKDWLEIVKLYEKDDIYLAEAAQLLVRNIIYELPSLKKQSLKCKQMQEECIKKEGDYAKNEHAMRENYITSCKQLGIEGKNVKKEVLSLVDELPTTLNTIAASAKELASCRDYYFSFLSFTLKEIKDEACLPLLRHIIEKGNTTTFEWRTGEAPDVVEVTTPAFPLDVDCTGSDTPDDQIDFGDLGGHSESGDDRSSISPNGDFVHVDRDECKPENGEQIDFGDSEINWDISVVDTTEISFIQTPSESEGSKVARGTDALSVLENESTRNSFYNDLIELESFLEQRVREIESYSGDVLASNLFQNAPPLLQMQSVDAIKDMLNSVKAISSQLMTTKLKHLYLIKSSPRYVDRLVDTLKSKLETAEKMVENQKVVKAKYHEAVNEQASIEPKIDLIVEKTKVLLSQVEKDISKRYKNRLVNIMGGMSALQQISAH
ncbi:CDK5 regulatory subunit-associated protein 3 isoform X2 [Parasteatoda tepidariorum]|uniref:CDK5 regulatory subunit-associated protein 3 isoform X1 n=1 Tax=Parasteatoda tepidariorum TaxID=114398 RepID=UPI001C727174|nr:CDK5 regulatory subunit-associated protein 3 isoform X1 [Parasteatoda tepidariorum]XP_042904887.1 CDK5 regulatory subunit-associated protein 3 isoform X2 [Parasteatoda tepidariorum]